MKNLKNFFYLLNKKEKNNFIILIFLITVVAILETISIGSIIPLIKIILDVNYIEQFKNFLNINLLQKISNEKIIFFILISIFCLFSIKYIFTIFFYYLLHKFTFNLKYRLQKKLFESYLYKNLNFFYDKNTSYLLRNLTSEIDQFSVAINSYLIITSEILIITGLILITVYTQSSSIIFTLLILTIITFIIFNLIKTKTENLGKERQKNIGNQLKTINDAFGLIIDIILQKKQSFFLEKFTFFSKKTISSLFLHNFYKSLPRIIFEWVFLGIIIVMLIFFINGNNFSNAIANITFLVAIMFKLIPSFNKTFVSFQDIKFSVPVLNAIGKNFSQIQKFDFNEKKISYDSNFNFEKIEFKDIFFSYQPKIRIFENLNLNISKNNFIGIYGDSGEGKTTFINLLLGLIHPNKGTIMVNNLNLNEIVELYQSTISYVPQNIYLLDSDIKENVCLEEEKNLNEEKIKNIKLALKEAEFFKNENEIKTETLSKQVGQNGINLSGGQMQRVGIARAFYRNSKILILDEATRSLDKNTEKEIIQTLIKKKNKITILMISHNLENFKQCDQILEIKNKNITSLKNYKL